MHEPHRTVLSYVQENDMPSDWALVAVGEVLSGTQYGMNAPSTPDGNVPIVGMKDIRDGRVLLDNLARTFVTEAELESYRLHRGDLLINRTNSLDQVGKVGMVNADCEVVFASYLVRLNVDRARVEPEYLIYWLNFDLAQRTIKRIATPAIGQANLNPAEFQKYCLVPIPPKAQRDRIVEILRGWDDAVAIADRLLAATQLKRSCHYRRLVSWAQWKTMPIESVIKAISRPVLTPTTAYKALGIRSHGKGTFQRLIERPEEIDMETVYLVEQGDLIVNITFAWEGAIALARPEDVGCYVSHRFPTFEVDEEKVNRDFLGYAVGSRQFFHSLGIASPGGAGRNRVLNKKAFLKLTIPFPPKEEQDLIAGYLLALDTEVRILKSYRASLARQRRGLIQKLLTGEWRVPLRDGEIDAMAARVAEEAAQ